MKREQDWKDFTDLLKQHDHDLTMTLKHYYYHAYGYASDATVAIALYRTVPGNYIILVSMNAGYSLIFMNQAATSSNRAMLSTADSPEVALMLTDEIARMIGATQVTEVSTL